MMNFQVPSIYPSISPANFESLNMYYYIRPGPTTLLAVFHVTCRFFLAVLRTPGVPPLLILVTLYNVAEQLFSDRFFPARQTHIWLPAFPSSWRFIFLLLITVPLFAFIQVLGLLASRFSSPFLIDLWNKAFGIRHPSHQEDFMFQRDVTTNRHELFNAIDEENPIVEHAERCSDLSLSRSTSPIARPHHRVWRMQLVAYLTLFCMSTWVGVHYEQPGDVRYRDVIRAAIARPRRQGYGKQEKIFVAAMFFNNEPLIPYWHDSLIKVIHYLGSDNVFVSIVESHSTDGSARLLEALDADLASMAVPRRILTQDEAVQKPDDMSGNNRIEFLAATRNRAMEPLMVGGYDKVIFSNDIFIEPESLVELLETNDGHYDMACGLDFGHFGAYDMWVLRDRQGKLASAIWPYFFDEVDYHAMQTESPVPVFTCWNGIVAFSADPLLPIALRSNRTLSNDILPFDLPLTHPAANNASMRGPSPALTPPIAFRASAPGECFSSESFLLPYDLRRQFNLEQIYVNPRVINGYDWRFYVYFKWLMRHPVLRWWIENVYNGAWMERAVMVVGDAELISRWDGGDCHPWW